MGKMRTIIEKCATRFRTELHGKLDTLSPKARLAVIAGMTVLFAVGCLYMTATAIAGFGKGSGTIEIRNMEKLKLRNGTDRDGITDTGYETDGLD